MTVAISGLSAVSLRKADGSEFKAGELKAGRLITITYDGAQYVADVSNTIEILTNTQYQGSPKSPGTIYFVSG